MNKRNLLVVIMCFSILLFTACSNFNSGVATEEEREFLRRTNEVYEVKKEVGAIQENQKFDDLKAVYEYSVKHRDDNPKVNYDVVQTLLADESGNIKSYDTFRTSVERYIKEDQNYIAKESEHAKNFVNLSNEDFKNPQNASFMPNGVKVFSLKELYDLNQKIIIENGYSKEPIQTYDEYANSVDFGEY